jgi:hypothetical protein
MDTLALAYLVIGLITGTVCGVGAFIFGLIEREFDFGGAAVCFAFGFFFWWAAVPYLLWTAWKELR